MKHSLRLYEAKHALLFPCGEATLHRRSRLHFSCAEGVLHSKTKRDATASLFVLVTHRRLELRTPWLKVKCSTVWASGSNFHYQSIIPHKVYFVNTFFEKLWEKLWEFMIIFVVFYRVFIGRYFFIDPLRHLRCHLNFFETPLRHLRCHLSQSERQFDILQLCILHSALTGGETPPLRRCLTLNSKL